MSLGQGLQVFKKILCSYALFIVVATSFARFTVPFPEKWTFEDAVMVGKKHFLDDLFNGDMIFTNESVVNRMEIMHREIIASLFMPIVKENKTNIVESLQFVWNVFTSMGDLRLDQSKLLSTYAIAILGIIIYLTNLLEWTKFLIHLCNSTFFEHLYEKNTYTKLSPNQMNQALNFYRIQERNRIERENDENDDNSNDELKRKKDPLFNYQEETKIKFDRVLLSHNLSKIHTPCIAFAFVMIIFAIIMSCIFWSLYNFSYLNESLNFVFDSMLTLRAPKWPANSWWKPLIYFFTSTISQILFLATLLTMSRDFFTFMANNFYRFGVKC